MCILNGNEGEGGTNRRTRNLEDRNMQSASSYTKHHLKMQETDPNAVFDFSS